MIRYLITLLVFIGLILAASAQRGSRKYEDFKCDYDWMYTQSHVWNAGRSHLNWFKRCIESENLDVNDQSAAHGVTALHTAAGLGEIDTVRYLIRKGANVETFDFVRGYTPLHEAVQSKKSGAVISLIDGGANVNAKTYSKKYPNNTGKSSLHISISNLDLITTRILLRNGAQVNSQDQYMNTPLTRLLHDPEWLVEKTEHRDLLISELCETLMDAGASVTVPDNHGRSPVDLAKQHVQEGNVDMEGCAKMVLSKVR